MLNRAFTAELRKRPQKDGWTHGIWPQSVAFFGTRGLVKVRQVIGKQAGDTVKVLLQERL